MNKLAIKNYISSIKFRLSDLFLAVGFLPMAIFLIFGQLFMQYPDSNNVALKLPIIIVLFIILLLSWSIYIYLEFKRGNVVNKYITAIFIILAIIGIIGIATQQNVFSIDFIAFYGGQVHVDVSLSTAHYLFFTFDIISILLLIYIGLFIFPKRFKSIDFIKFLGIAVFILCFALILYSLIAEFDNYRHLIEALKNADIDEIKDNYSIKSFIINANAYGMTMMLGILFCLIFHCINNKHWWLFILAAFFYINMIFSFCRASLLLSLLITIIYIYYISIKTINHNKRISVITLIITSSILLVSFFIIFIAYFSKGKVLSYIYKLISLFDSGSTISFRERIWNNTYQIIGNNLIHSLLIGNGFGLINEILLQMNLNSGFDNQLLFPTHNSYLNLLAEGGLLYLFAYLALLGYVAYILIKCHKKKAPLTLCLSFGILIFVVYSLTETIHYLVYPFIFLVFVYYNTLDRESNKV